MRTKDENKHQAIYQAAMEVINDEGMEHASMSKIAKAAGVSSSTLYVYFENKQDMLNKLYLMAKKESSMAAFDGFSPDMEPKFTIGLLYHNMYRYMRENPTKFSFLEQFYNSPNISDDVKQVGIAYFDPIYTFYEQVVKSGLLKNHPIRLVEAFVFPSIMSLVRADISGELQVTPAILDQAIDLLWLGLKK